MSRRDELLDSMVRHLGAAYYQALRGGASPEEVGKAVAQVAEASGNGGAPAEDEMARVFRRTGRWQVSDVMTTKVVSVGKHASYREVAHLLHKSHLTALPVVTESGQVAGVVSEADLLRKQERHEQPDKKPAWRLHPAASAKAEARTAEKLMTAPAVTIGPDALLGTAARVMNAHHVKRLPVVSADGEIVGIVSRTDLLRAFLRPDEEIGAEARAVLTDILLADPASVHVSVRDGVVNLAGRLASDDQIATAVRLTEAIDGVVAVSSNLSAPPPGDWPGGGYHLPR